MTDCSSPARKRGLCGKHYQRLMKTGDSLGVRPGRWDGYRHPDCSECDRPAHANGLCTIHSKRAERHGDPVAGRRLAAMSDSIVGRLNMLVDRRGPSDCWPWNAAPLPSGYGQLCFEGRRMYAHRAAFEAAHGPVPAGLVVDHRCHNEDISCAGGSVCLHRRCCNPAHLEAVTHRVNARRATLRSNADDYQ